MNGSWTYSTLTQGLPLLLAVIFPVMLAAASVHRPWRWTIVVMAPWSALPALLLAVLAPSGMTLEMPWLMLGTHLGLDATARVFLFFTSLLWLLAGIYARSYVDHDDNRAGFFTFYLISMSGNLGLILAQDMLSFFLCFATMSFASYGLIVHNRDREALFAGRIYMILVVLGEVSLFSAMVLAAGSAGSLSFQDVTRTMAQVPGRELMLTLFLVGFGIKVGALPLHVWLPLAHPAAPTPASAVLSGTMIKAGLLGWMRFLPLGEVAFPSWGMWCMAAGLAAAFYGVLVGLTQRHPKTVLAYSSISQMGLMTVGIGCGLAAPASWSSTSVAVGMYALHHALAKGALFLGIGVAAARIDTAWKRYLVCGGLLLPSLALAGAPFTSGAAAKVGLKTVTAMAPSAWTGVLETFLPLAAIGTTVLMGRFLFLAWPRPILQSSCLLPGLWWPWTLLLVSVALSVFVWPWDGSMTSLHHVLSRKESWKALWPVGIGALVAYGVWGWVRWGRWRSGWQIPAGDLLMPLCGMIENVRQRWYTSVITNISGGSDRVVTQLAALGVAKQWHTVLTRCEHCLGGWRVAGTLFLLLVATLLVCLIALSR